MRHLRILFVLLLAWSTATARADENPKRALAGELLDLMNVETSFTESKELMKESYSRQMQQIGQAMPALEPDVKPALEEIDAHRTC